MAQEPQPREGQVWVRDLDDIFAGEKPYLGDPETVDAIVRTFLSDVIDGQAKDEDALAARVGREVDRFLGRDEALIPIPAWNSPTGGVVKGAARRYEVTGTPEEIVGTVFYRLVESYLAAAEESAQGRDWDYLIEGAIEMAVAVLMGTDGVQFPFEVTE